MQISLTSLKKENQKLNDCFKQCMLFVNATFNDRERKEIIFEQCNDQDKFLFITHKENWENLKKIIKKQAGTEVK